MVKKINNQRPVPSVIGWFANQKEKKSSDLVVVALQTKVLAAKPRNSGECQIKEPGKMRTKERRKKKEYEGRLGDNGGGAGGGSLEREAKI